MGERMIAVSTRVRTGSGSDRIKGNLKVISLESTNRLDPVAIAPGSDTNV